VAEARLPEQRGVDAIIVQGTEAGAIPAGSLRQPPAVRD